MRNIFEKANAGDLFKTRDGRIAKYDHWLVDGGKTYYFFTTEYSGFVTDETGKSMYQDITHENAWMPAKYHYDDIVGEYDGNVALVETM